MNSQRQLICLTAVFAFAIGPAFAAGQDTACPLTYEVFEYSVPHTDMEKCPASMEIEKAYCRVAVVAEVATIFAFSDVTNCIVKSKAYQEADFKMEFK